LAVAINPWISGGGGFYRYCWKEREKMGKNEIQNDKEKIGFLRRNQYVKKG